VDWKPAFNNQSPDQNITNNFAVFAKFLFSSGNYFTIKRDFLLGFFRPLEKLHDTFLPKNQ
jgi:hypothetical protein